MGVVLDNAYTHKLLACAYSVHSALGPGLLESVYEAALVYELNIINFNVESLRDGIYRVINGYITP